MRSVRGSAGMVNCCKAEVREQRGHVGMVTRGQGERQRSKGAAEGDRNDGWGYIFGSQVSAVGYQVRVFRFGYGCGA